MGLMISCKDATRLISQMQDGNIPPWQRVRIRLHLFLCEACTRFERQVRFLHAALREYRN